MAAQRFQRKHFSRRPDALLIAAIGLLSAGLIFVIPYLTAGGDKGANNPQQSGSRVPQSLKGLPPSDLTEDQAIAHALNRLGYGPRPGDIEAVKQIGLAKWVDRQLHPESIDDSAMQARLSRFPTLTMSSQALLDKFPRPQVAAKREGVTPQQYREEQQAKLQAARQASGDGQEHMAATNGDAQANGNSSPADNGPAASVAPQNMTPDELAEILLPGAKNAAKGGGNPLLNYEQLKTPQRIVAELSMAKMTAPFTASAARRTDGGFLVQPLQCFCRQGRGPLAAHRLRTRRHSPARHGQIPRPARGHREKPGDALLPG